MNKLIFETMLAEASFRVAERTIKGVDLDEAIHEVVTEMELDKTEAAELTVRAKKAPKPKPVVEDEVDMDDVMDGLGDEEETSDVEPNTIVFHSPEDLETAVGVLMYKGIAWNTRKNGALVFDNATDVAKAKEALDRRWDFIAADQRTVAVIEFDNLEDYQKVLDFIGSKKMTVLVNGGGQELDEDYDVETAKADAEHKKAKKDAKETGLPAPERVERAMSFSALRKDREVRADDLQPLTDPAARQIKVSKRWK
jgi:hypothetical protein